MGLRARFEQFIFREYDLPVQSLGLFRIAFALYVLAGDLPKYLWISEFPGSFFHPPVGLTYFFWNNFPPVTFFYILNIALVVSAVFLLLGKRTILASLFLAGSTFAGNMWAYSFGKINHDELSLILIPVLMAAAGWGNAYSLDRQQGNGQIPRVKAWCTALLALCVSLAMVTAAVPKITSGWLDLDTSATYGYVAQYALAADRLNVITSLALATPSKLLWETADIATVVLELAFILLVWNRGAFRFVCAVACTFHFGIAVLMGITFEDHLLAYAAFIRWCAVARWLQVRFGFVGDAIKPWLRSLGQLRSWQIGITGTGLALLFLAVSNPVFNLQNALFAGYKPGFVYCFLAALAGIAYLAHTAGTLLSRFFSSGQNRMLNLR